MTRWVLKQPCRPAHLHVPRYVGMEDLHTVSVRVVVDGTSAVAAWVALLRVRCIVCQP